jgi:hypothetical protein
LIFTKVYDTRLIAMHVARRNSNFRKMAFDFSNPPIAQIGENEALKIIGVFKSLNLSQF